MNRERVLRVRVARDAPVSGAFEWARYDETGAPMDHGAGGPDAPGPAGPCELVIAADLVLLERVAVSAAQRARLAKGLRYLAEDSAAADPERLHVAAEASPGRDSVALGIVDRQWLAQTLARLARAGLAPRAAYPELLLAPLAPRSWTVAWDGVEGFVRCAALDGYALDRAAAGAPPVALSLALEKARAGGRAPDRIVVRPSAAAAAALPDLGRWSAVLGLPVEAGSPWHWHDGALGSRRPPLDLLQGEFAPQGTRGGLTGRLRRSALLAGMLAAIVSVGIAADWHAKARERDALVAEMRAIYRDSFGAGAVVVDPPLQMRRALAALRARGGALAASDFVALLGALGDGLLEPAAHRIETIEYKDGVLDLTVHARDAAQAHALLDSLRSQAPARGLTIRGEVLGPQAARIRLSVHAESPR